MATNIESFLIVTYQTKFHSQAWCIYTYSEREGVLSSGTSDCTYIFLFTATNKNMICIKVRGTTKRLCI